MDGDLIEYLRECAVLQAPISIPVADRLFYPKQRLRLSWHEPSIRREIERLLDTGLPSGINVRVDGVARTEVRPPSLDRFQRLLVESKLIDYLTIANVDPIESLLPFVQAGTLARLTFEPSCPSSSVAAVLGALRASIQSRGQSVLRWLCAANLTVDSAHTLCDVIQSSPRLSCMVTHLCRIRGPDREGVESALARLTATLMRPPPGLIALSAGFRGEPLVQEDSGTGFVGQLDMTALVRDLPPSLVTRMNWALTVFPLLPPAIEQSAAFLAALASRTAVVPRIDLLIHGADDDQRLAALAHARALAGVRCIVMLTMLRPQAAYAGALLSALAAQGTRVLYVIDTFAGEELLEPELSPMLCPMEALVLRSAFAAPERQLPGLWMHASVLRVLALYAISFRGLQCLRPLQFPHLEMLSVELGTRPLRTDLDPEQWDVPDAALIGHNRPDRLLAPVLHRLLSEVASHARLRALALLIASNTAKDVVWPLSVVLRYLRAPHRCPLSVLHLSLPRTVRPLALPELPELVLALAALPRLNTVLLSGSEPLYALEPLELPDALIEALEGNRTLVTFRLQQYLLPERVRAALERNRLAELARRNHWRRLVWYGLTREAALPYELVLKIVRCIAPRELLESWGTIDA